MHVLGCRWVFRTQLNADGTLKKRRSRLVAKGYEQSEGIDYLDTYSPMVRTATIRTVLHLATVLQWEMRQFDFQHAFLHGNLQETVYMRQPAGFVDEEHPDYVCLLHKAIYGLKQAPRAWFDKFSTFLLEFGFVCSFSDPSMFVCIKGTNIIILLLYVDEMLVTGNNSKLLQDLLESLNTQFKMKDLGQLGYFLGIQIYHHSDGLFMSQQKYAEDLLAIASMSDCSLPLDLNRVTEKEELFSYPTYFQSLAGKLQYLTLTRPDIQFAMNYVCQKMHAPSVFDFHHLKRILRYVKGTVTMGVSFTRHTDFKVTAYSDSDWSGCPTTSRSTGGFSTYLGSNLISWSSKKQSTISKSSTEAEYRSLSETASEITWLCLLLKDLCIPLPATLLLLCDNLSAVMLAANPSFHSKTKHFTRDHHYIREQVALKAIEVRHISNKLQIADVFTKSLPQEPFRSLRSKLGVCLPPTQSLRGPISEKPKPIQTWRPKNSLNPNDAATSSSTPYRTCEQDKIMKGSNEKAMMASVKEKACSAPAHAITTATRFQALSDELA